jgi:Na+/H+ antiporter NhaD/arsenite permease-like protein
MQLLKFLFGIILVQVATVSLVFLWDSNFSFNSLIKLAIPLLFIALIIAFWFTSITKYYTKDIVNKMEISFANEREKLKLNAEKAKREIEKEAQKEAQKSILREATKTQAKANFKVGAAFAGVLGIGALFVFAQMVTVGLIALSATGGAVGGYYLRGKRDKKRELENSNKHIEIENKPNPKLLKFTKK